MSTSPILAGFFPDPTICRADDVFYIANSSFEYFPAVPLHKSSDLVNWESVGHVFEDPRHLDIRGAPDSGGIYAPTLRHRGGRFYLATSDVETPQLGHMITSSHSATGPWSVAVRTPWARGIDADLFWDRDGVCFLSWSGHDERGELGIRSAPFDPLSGEQLGPIRDLWQGTGLAYPEGPHLFSIGGLYYCMLAEGGTERGHCVTIARAADLAGPWEPCPGNPILTHRSTVSAVQNTGHADLVQAPGGAWAMVHLGVRPRGGSPGFHVNGRETFLVGVDWKDGWPLVIEDRYEVPESDHAFVDLFSGARAHPRWISPRARAIDATSVGHNHKRLKVVAISDDEGCDPAICTRVRDEEWVVEADVDTDVGTAALQVRTDSSYWAEVRYDGELASAHLCVAGVRHELCVMRLAAADSLVVAAQAPRHPEALLAGPDRIILAIRAADANYILGELDGRLLSTEVAGGFTGRVVGLRAVVGSVELGRFTYRPHSTLNWTSLAA